MRRLFSEHSLNYHNHESSLSLIVSSQLQVFKDCTGMSQSSVCSTTTSSSSNFSTTSRTTSSTSRTSSSASDVFRIHFKDTDEDDVLSMDTKVDIYLLEHLIARENFDILDWWKENSLRYEVLSQIDPQLLLSLHLVLVAGSLICFVLC